ncbi:hypothetical protein CAOG_010076 [Capsaspora owczarzaki ATCC 30864]|uniref:Uncharacterized protein n=1 Tax=Capsaspora owczarzaki (strain ATCC 30864) TaxID=595528 RepID=A0A0D2VZ69_CAPO3|nr:hypothetical protein CAOG_010076 [Capsaspora owczarzaki ATCC 30864]
MKRQPPHPLISSSLASRSSLLSPLSGSPAALVVCKYPQQFSKNKQRNPKHLKTANCRMRSQCEKLMTNGWKENKKTTLPSEQDLFQQSQSRLVLRTFPHCHAALVLEYLRQCCFGVLVQICAAKLQIQNGKSLTFSAFGLCRLFLYFYLYFVLAEDRVFGF